jgi:hypothetical protein
MAQLPTSASHASSRWKRVLYVGAAVALVLALKYFHCGPTRAWNLGAAVNFLRESAVSRSSEFKVSSQTAVIWPLAVP